MKLCVLSDILAYLPALLAVSAEIEAWAPDAVVMAGDVVNRGPSPKECLDFLLEQERSRGWRLLRGNHEDYVIHQARPGAPQEGPLFEAHRPSVWTYRQLDCDVSALQAMPGRLSLAGPDGREVRFVHASMIHNRDGIYPETTDQDLGAKIGAGETQPAALFCVGHTHRPLVRSLSGTLVVNAGSAGLPFDGDTRPAYARLTWKAGRWSAAIRRVEYDLDRAGRDFIDKGYLEAAGPLVRLVQIELREARSLLFGWAIRYQKRVEAGEISMEESVKRYLGDQVVR
jgi:predicted phosphodiesterase